jgi:uncharacterized protein YcaQ
LPTEKTIIITIETARRLAVVKQGLAGPGRKGPAGQAILAVVRDLGFVQWDPIEIVAPSHIISLWSRIGKFPLSVLDRLLWDDKRLFEHWSHAASLVLTEDYPLHYSLMRRYPESLSKSWGGWRASARKFLAEHAGLRKKILSELKKGPLQPSQFEDYQAKKSSDGWGSGSDVSTMLFHLQMSGEVMIVGHEGKRNIWGLSEQFLPDWVERKALSEQEVEREGAERSIRALGVATASNINRYFLRGRYLNLKKTLDRLQEDSTIHRVHVSGLAGRDDLYVHDRDLTLFESLNSDAWQPRMSLVAPFDNMVAVQEWTKRLFGFDYVHEQFLPKAKRKFGTFVLPILWGDRFIGRIDPEMDRKKERLLIHSVHAEPGAPGGKEASSAISETIASLAEFLGAKEVTYSARVPTSWKSSLR